MKFVLFLLLSLCLTSFGQENGLVLDDGVDNDDPRIVLIGTMDGFLHAIDSGLSFIDFDLFVISFFFSFQQMEISFGSFTQDLLC